MRISNMTPCSPTLTHVIAVALTILLVQVPLVSGQDQQETRFYRQNITCGQLEAAGQCPAQTGAHVSRLRCGSLCAANDACEGFRVDAQRRCFFLSASCAQSPGLCEGVLEQTVVVYSRQRCNNSGEWLVAEKRCQCSGGYVGTRCERLARNCRELMDYNYPNKRQKVSMHPPGAAQPMTIFCTINSQNNLALTFLALNTRRFFSFNRTWDEYVQGFYHDTAHTFWLGLDNMHTLYPSASNAILCLRFSIGPGNATQFYFRYYGFSISDSSSSYTFRFDRTVHNTNKNNLTSVISLEDCVSTGDGIPFSTPDFDNDFDAVSHCAKLAGTGWWFDYCSPSLFCNPLGQRYRPSDDIKPGYVQPNGDGWQNYKDTIQVALYAIDKL